MTTLASQTTCPICNLPIAALPTTLHHSCPFCARSFRRVDAARRHARSCPARRNRVLPEAKRGRKSRACDKCSADKTSCDGALPCARCVGRSVDCGYSSLCHDASHREGKEEKGDGTRFTETAGRDERMTLSFLLEWSDPRRDPMLRMMESEEDPASDKERESAMPGLSAWLEGTIDPALLLLDLPLDGGLYDMGDPGLEGVLANSSPSAATKRIQILEPIFRDKLVPKPELRGGLESCCNNGFFTSSHLERALSTDGRTTSQLATFIHWPTFDTERVSLPLLLAVVVLRTSYLDYSRASNVSMLNTDFLELVEDYIFQNLRENDKALSESPHRLRLAGPGFNTCQAAGVIISVQCTINNPKARERMAAERIPYMAGILRKSGMIRLKHSMPLNEISWRDFALTESQIRLAMAIHNNCALLSSFCNHPPSIAVREMTGSLPCTNDIWEADSQAEFEARQRLVPNVQLPSSFSEANGILLGDDWVDSKKSNLSNLTVHQLFILIIGFQSVVYNYRASMFCGNTSSVLLRALDRWAALWIQAMQHVTDHDMEVLGMTRIAPELAFLMKRVLEVLGTAETKGLGYFDGAVRYDTADLHDFVRTYGLPGSLASSIGG